MLKYRHILFFVTNYAVKNIRNFKIVSTNSQNELQIYNCNLHRYKFIQSLFSELH